jgi:hypothetical protein
VTRLSKNRLGLCRTNIPGDRQRQYSRRPSPGTDDTSGRAAAAVPVPQRPEKLAGAFCDVGWLSPYQSVPAADHAAPILSVTAAGTGLPFGQAITTDCQPADQIQPCKLAPVRQQARGAIPLRERGQVSLAHIAGDSNAIGRQQLWVVSNF